MKTITPVNIKKNPYSSYFIYHSLSDEYKDKAKRYKTLSTKDKKETVWKVLDVIDRIAKQYKHEYTLEDLVKKAHGFCNEARRNHKYARCIYNEIILVIEGLPLDILKNFHQNKLHIQRIILNKLDYINSSSILKWIEENKLLDLIIKNKENK